MAQTARKEQKMESHGQRRRVKRKGLLYLMTRLE